MLGKQTEFLHTVASVGSTGIDRGCTHSCKKNIGFLGIGNSNQCLEFSSQCSSPDIIVTEFILVITAVKIFITASRFPPENLNSTVAETSEW